MHLLSQHLVIPYCYSSDVIQPYEINSSNSEEVEVAQDLITPKRYPKALGVHWVASLYVLHTSIPSFGAGEFETSITKRSIASAVVRVYDVLGWHAPTILTVKIVLREYWQLHLGWAHKVLESIIKEWNCWKNPLLNNYPIQHVGSILLCLGLRKYSLDLAYGLHHIFIISLSYSICMSCVVVVLIHWSYRESALSSYNYSCINRV